MIKELDITRQLDEIKRSNSLYHQKSNNIQRYHAELYRIVILADDGTATDATFIAAIRSIKTGGYEPLIIMDTPIAPKSTVALLMNENIDHIEVH